MTSPNPTRFRLLIVDDDPMVVKGVRRLLGSAHEVATATSADDALLQLARDASFDVVLCDVLMPDVDGPSFVRAVQARHPRLENRFILMTGSAFASGSLAVTNRQEIRCIAKPFRKQQLLDAIREAIASQPPAPT